MRTERLLGASALACVAAASACFAMASQSTGDRHLVPFAAPAAGGQLATSIATSTDPGRARLRPRVGVVRPARPVRVVIPAVGLSARVVPVGLGAAAHVTVPDPSLAGWYRSGTAARAPGPVVLVGHVDSDHGPAVFYRLSGVRVGETVRVERADGSTSPFTIGRISVVAKADFPSREVFAPTARSTIRLITCSGRFDADEGGYVDSLVVWGHVTSP
jgi:hypothetical protein